MTEQSEQAKFEKISDELAAWVRNVLAYYRRGAKVNRRMQRGFSIIVVILSVVTPILVSQILAWPESPQLRIWFQVLSLIASAALGITEGISRVYAFDKQWADNYNAMLSLQRARAEYKIRRIGKTGKDWQNDFVRYHDQVLDIVSHETSKFFSNVKMPPSNA